MERGTDCKKTPEWNAIGDGSLSPDAARTVAAAAKMARQRARELGIAPDVAFGLLREGLELTPTELESAGDATIERALHLAVENRRFEPADPGALDRVRAQLAASRVNGARVATLLDGSELHHLADVTDRLERAGIDTLADLKSPAGLDLIAEIGRKYGPQAERELAGQVELSVIEADASRRRDLLNAGFTTLDDVVRRSLSEFVETLAPTAGWVQSVRWHAKAQAMTTYARRRVTEERINNTLIDVQGKLTGRDKWSEIMRGDAAPCECDDCNAATSPLAYLADLLKYCDDNLIRTGGKIDYAFLAGVVHQPLGDLPTRCDAVSESVRQVRIAVEVLREHRRVASGGRRVASLAERTYLRTVHETLLSRLGTSSIELRLAVSGDAATRHRFGERLGIDGSIVTAGQTRLQRLRVDTESGALDAVEAQLEAVFGFPSTTVDAATRLGMAKATPEFIQWRTEFLARQWFDQDWPDDSPGAGVPVVDPDVIGPDDFRTPLAQNPAWAIWTRRRTWVDAQLTDLTAAAAGVGAGASRARTCFDRMSITGAPATYTPAAGTAVTPTWGDTTVNPAPATVMMGLRAELSSNDAGRIATARATLESRFGLTAKAHVRLVELYDREQTWLADSRRPPLTSSEIAEIVSILTQARKQLIIAAWRQEEATASQITGAARFEFGPAQFWMSLTEPAIAEWPPVDDGRTPWLDPEGTAGADVPDGEVGARARALLAQRQAAVRAERDAIRAATGGLVGAVQYSYDTPAVNTSGAALLDYLDATLTALNSPDPTQSATAMQRVTGTLFLDESDFRRLMALLAMERQTDPAFKPTASERDEAIAILTASRKRRVLYPAWRTEERDLTNGLRDWQARKISMPVWRGSPDTRVIWRRALSIRSTLPIVDPDLVDRALLVRDPALVTAAAPTAPMFDKAAFRWKLRRAEIDGFMSTLRTARASHAGDADQGLAAVLDPMSLTAATLAELAGAGAAGRSISRRMRQLDLEPDGFDALGRVARLVAAGQNVETPEWETVIAIITQVWKRRRRQTWRVEESTASIALDPAAFKMPVSEIGLGGAQPWEPPAWRARVEDRLDWENRLQGRLDQLTALSTGHADVINAAEQAALPTLRDSLILAAPTGLGTAASLASRATYLEDRLLIDLQNSGCAMTTRVAQAIETIQNLLFSLRTGQLRGTYPDWQIRPSALSEFDAIWRWLGSYATWRAAIFVLLYPENLAVPSLRRTGSPGFWQLIADLRDQNPITPDQALEAHRTFRNYFLDLATLEDSSVRVSTTPLARFYDERRLYTNGTTASTTFLFGLTPPERGRRLYWSTRYYDATGRPQQGFWRRLEQFTESIEEVLGASAYTTLSGRAYLYLVVKTSKDQTNHLWFLRFDLQVYGTWDSEATAISLTNVSGLPQRFNAFLLQTSPSEPPRIRVEDPANTANMFTLFLDSRGESGDPAVQQLGQPTRYSDLYQLPVVGATSFSSHSVETVQINGQWPSSVEVVAGGSVAASLRNATQTDVIVAHAIKWTRWARNQNETSTSGVIVYYRVLWNVNQDGTPASTSGWIQGPELSGLHTSDQLRACALAWLPGTGTAASRLTVFVAHTINANSTDRVTYWVGDPINTANGSVANWGNPRDAHFSQEIYRGSMGVAITPSVTAPFEIRIVTAVPGESANPSTGSAATLARGILRRNTIATNGDLVASTWLDPSEVPLAGTAGMSTAGLALTVAQLKGTETQCLVLCWLVEVPAGGENVAYLQVWDGTKWTVTHAVPGWFGAEANGIGVAVADVNRDGRLDLVIYHGDIVRDERGAANLFTRVAYGIGLGARTIQGEAVPRPFKPIYPDSYPRAFGPAPLPHAQLENVDVRNASNTRSNRATVEEMFYFGPIAIGLALQKSGEYLAALDWFRSVYDYAQTEPERGLYRGIEQNPGTGIWRDADWDWMLDPLNPHAIAAGRRGVYLRFTLLTLIRCLLDYADAEFTRDTAESLPLARTLYRTALRLLGNPAIAQRFGTCDQFIDQLVFTYGDVPWIPPILSGVHIDTVGRGRELVERVQAAMTAGGDEPAKAARVAATVGEFQRAYRPRSLADDFDRARDTYSTLTLGIASEPSFRNDLANLGFSVDRGVELGLSGHFGGTAVAIEDRTRITTRGIEDVGGELLMPWNDGPPVPPPGGGDDDGLDLGRFGPPSIDDLQRFGAEHFGTIPFIEPENHPGFVGKVDVNGKIPQWEPPEFEPVPPVMSILACVPPNPILKSLRLRADANLFKLRTCRNIAGMRRDVDAYAAATDTQTGMPVIGADGQLSLPGLVAPPPTPYRFRVLLERARNLVQIGQQVESSMLVALQQADAERYALLRARQDVQTARGGVQLQMLRVSDAENGRRLVELQQERTRVVLNHYGSLLNEGMLPAEEAALAVEIVVAGLQATAAAAFAYTGTEAAAAASFGIQAVSSVAGILRQVASFERQRQEWAFQQALAREDVRITNQQYQLAEDQVRIANQERIAAELQVQHDEAAVEFLSQKFTNVELFDWMAQVMEGVYKYFLQQATATARLAAGQLGFERQETVPPFIQADYWRSLSEAGPPSSDTAAAPDRRGLTGSVRLLQDIVRLEQFAFETDRRKLQLTKTISLAEIAPVAFQRFRESGVLTFTTPMELFDRDFPGHYLRLIRRVRVSLVALTPSASIRATLTCGRISRVVVGGDLYQTVRVQHGPDLVALSSPRDSSGLFDLDMQSDMLGPFESIGVDTTWELRLPKPANPFDFRSIADVMFSIDYTALNSVDYQAQVLQTLRPVQSAMRAWSFRQHFPDQWYDLNNAELSPEPMTVRWTIDSGDFPPHLLGLSTTALTMYFVRRPGAKFELPSVELRFREDGAMSSVGGDAGTVDGIVATAGGNAASWFGMLGASPNGTWELTLPDTESLRARFHDGDIEDVLFVVGYNAQLPAWPV